MTSSPSPSEAVVEAVVLDYPGLSTPARTKTALLPDGRLACRYPLETHRPRTVDTSAYVGEILGRLVELPEVVVAYCAASTVARDLVGRVDVPPLLVAINPEAPEPEQGPEALRGFAVAAGADAAEAGRWVAGLSGDADLGAVGRRLTDLHLRRLAEQTGASPEPMRPIADELATLQLEWVQHLVAASRCSHDVGAGELHLTSADRRCRPDCPAVHRQLGDTEPDLFSDRRVADAVVDAVRAWRQR